MCTAGLEPLTTDHNRCGASPTIVVVVAVFGAVLQMQLLLDIGEYEI
jgi:hypothetical protein